jgi:hypothetical protein
MDLQQAIELMARLERMALDLEAAGIGVVVDVRIDARVGLVERAAVVNGGPVAS